MLMHGLSMLLVLSVVQRAIGFGRQVFFCRELDASQFGLWELSYGFLVVVSPLVVLALPGTLGRYAGVFADSGTLRAFLCHIATICILTTFAAAGVMFVTPTFWSRVIFDSTDPALVPLIQWTAISLAMANAMNFAWEMFTALKDLRGTAMLQFGSSAGFALLALLMLPHNATAPTAMIAYLGSCVAVVGWAAWRGWRLVQTLPADTRPLPIAEMGRRIGPTALWLGTGVVMVLAFDYVDRLLPVRLLGAEEGIRLVGTVGSARVVPMLLVSVTTMLIAAMMPHWADDHRRSRTHRLVRRVDFFLGVQTAMLVMAGLAMGLAVPWVLGPLFLNHYASAEAVFPIVTLSAIGLALIQIIQGWFLCIERLGQSVTVLGAGLFFKVLLAAVLIPRYGLVGSVAATLIAHFGTLAALVAIASYHGLRLRATTWLILAVLTLSAIFMTIHSLSSG